MLVGLVFLVVMFLCSDKEVAYYLISQLLIAQIVLQTRAAARELPIKA